MSQHWLNGNALTNLAATNPKSKWPAMTALRAAGTAVDINFGSYKFEIRKFAWTEGQPPKPREHERSSSACSLRPLRSLRLNKIIMAKKTNKLKSVETLPNPGVVQTEAGGADLAETLAAWMMSSSDTRRP